jgi:hypothetical protein
MNHKKLNNPNYYDLEIALEKFVHYDKSILDKLYEEPDFVKIEESIRQRSNNEYQKLDTTQAYKDFQEQKELKKKLEEEEKNK